MLKSQNNHITNTKIDTKIESRELGYIYHTIIKYYFFQTFAILNFSLKFKFQRENLNFMNLTKIYQLPFSRRNYTLCPSCINPALIYINVNIYKIYLIMFQKVNHD